ncbi:SDR family NAD(P)-dependent oxidoreductase [Streptomyces sp. B21-108]|uniref:SDR family NAD(P)-dependent oxidoreductase n=1 Tax=Streptomyces sp. B21-108 TaxID=3039419 RepID=UPI002FF097AB
MTDSPRFTETFTVTADNPLLRGHVVDGRRLLPAVGCVDLVLQVLARHGQALPDVVLRNLTVLAPLTVAPGEQVLVTVEGRGASGGGTRVEVRGRHAEDSTETTHAVVTAHPTTAQDFPDRLPLPLAASDRSAPLADIFAWCREHGLVHSDLMKAAGTLHRYGGDWIAALELAPEHRDSADAFVFHPALFEAALLSGGVASGLPHDDGTPDGRTPFLPSRFELYLPLVIESFRATASPGSHCYVRIPAASVSRDDELVRLAMEFYDPAGVKFAEVGQYVGKRVRTPTAAFPEATPPTPPTAPTLLPDAGVLGVVRQLVAERLDVTPERVDVHAGYYDMGLASADLLSVVTRLGDRLSLDLSPTVMFEHRTVAELAAWLEPRVAGDISEGPLSAVRATVAELLCVPPEEVAPDGALEDLGLDWTGLAQLADRLGERHGRALAPTVFLEHRTVRAVAAHLAAAPVVPGGPAQPHPMLERADADGPGTLYTARFDGTEPYLRDHVVRGGRVLPGVVHLEMARAAVADALGQERAAGLRLDDVVWLRPAVSGPAGLELRVTVSRLTEDSAEYEIHAVAPDDEPVLCGQGRASRPEPAGAGRPGLAEARAVCTGATFTADDVYALYSGAGLDYGPSQRALVRLHTGTDDTGRPQALAELRLPVAAEPLDGCLLHPSILDGALQATVGLRMAAGPVGDGPAQPALPFALRHLETVAATPARAYAWIRPQPHRSPRTASAPLDITVFDDQGRVCVELTGLSTRTLRPQHTAPHVEAPLVPAAPSRRTPADIAIVGLSGRYPEAEDLDAFWANLRAGRDCVREIPSERWDPRRYADPAAGAGTPARWGGFLDGIDRFDPLFFQISLLEADYLDPQERLFLQSAHHALEDAGYTGEALSRAAAGPGGGAPGKVGVFVGVMYQEYQLFGAQAQERGHRVALSGSAATIANRVSYFYGFTGPSMALDTMCSGSLTAIHLACEAIRSGQCGAALAGGVNLSSHPNKYLLLGMRNFLSSDGRCRSFGEGGDGYVPGEGVGAVLLKPLEQAVADGDHIHGVIKGTAVNHGGRTPGYSVPSPVAQGEVIADALVAAGVDARTLGYLEAHGTGTALGDPIEIAGLTKGLQRAGGLPERCAIGSVKSNIGHGESASGIAGLTKVLLQMRHGELVPSLHSASLNPHIDFDRTPLRVQQRLEPWPRPVLELDGERRTHPRTAGVSSFGAGGSNAHLVVTEYVPEPDLEPELDRRPAPGPDASGRPSLLVLSARSEEQLAEQARRLAVRLGELSDDDLPDVAWTLQTGRMPLEERFALAAGSVRQARERLSEFAAGPSRPGPWIRGTVRTGPEAPTPEQTRTELGEALAAWSAHGTHDRLLRLWTEGAAIDWAALRPPARPARRVSLPGYPFARERCWLDLDDAAPPVPASASEPSGPTPPAANGEELMLLRPVWTEREGAPAVPGEEFSARHVVVLGRLGERDGDALRAALPAGTVCRFLPLDEGALDRRYTDVAREAFTLTREILSGGARRPVLLQVVLTGDPGTDAERDRLACFGGLAGLLRTARLEDPRLHAQYVECLDGAAPATVAARLVAENGAEPEVRYRAGRRHVVRMDELTGPRPVTRQWKEGGVYLITGGTGGLGLIVARDIAATTNRATVILTGRSPLTGAQRAALDALREHGLTVDHRRADVSDRDSVAGLLAHVADRHGPLTGVVHSAGVLNDGLLIRKTPEQFERVLAPKVAGVVHLDELTRDQPLETFLCFSSTSGAFGNVGQADYAAANAFLDAYAAHRNRLVDAGLRSGRTVSIGWPLWDEGGMGADPTLRARLRDLGFAPLDTARGLEALRCAQAADDNGLGEGRLLVLLGRREALPPGLLGPAAPDTVTRPAVTGTPDREESAVTSEPVADGVLEERAAAHLRRVIAGALKLGPERLGADTPLERYGMDSVIAVTLTSRLEEEFGPLPRTLLFEAQTVRELARYVMAEHPDALRALLGEPAAPQPTLATSPAAQAPDAVAAAAQQPAAQQPPAVSAPQRPATDIAVIGVSGLYPQADDLDAFWDNLRSGKDCVTRIPEDRWERLYGTSPDEAGPTRGTWGAFLDGIDRFDPLLFGISPREAAAMDPQQRLFLQTVWHLLEQSGVTQDALEHRYGRRVGVYVGAAYQMYRADDSDPVLAALTATTSYNLIANRVSYFFGLEGPSLAVDNMCTSSATAIHLACADLQRGEAELAVAGGVNLTVDPAKYVALSEMQLLGSHPGSRSFRDGDGYLPAEAVGAVLLKPLDAALRDGDTVHAVIKASATAHGGRANGFMTPSLRTQVSLMRRALERAGAAPESIGYVEAAANGTTITDEVELRALGEVFRDIDEPVAVGTVKSALGHPEAASGIAQLTKVILQLRHGQLPPLVEAGDPNPRLDPGDGPLRLCTGLAAWEPRATTDADGRPLPRRALVNSVAAGGSHVALVVEAPPPAVAAEPPTEDTGPQVVVVSAGDAERLHTAVQRLHDFLTDGNAPGLADLAYTTQLGREELPERLAVVAASHEELRAALADCLGGEPEADQGTPPPVVLRGNAEDDAGPLDAMLSGTRGAQFLSGLVEDGDLERLAGLWVRGTHVPWRELHPGPRRIVPLPPTAFAPDSHWLVRDRARPAGEPSRAPAATVTSGPHDGTRTDAEHELAHTWAALLQIDVERLNARSDFFSLGGNSLLATRLTNLIRQDFGVDLPVQAVFDHPKLVDMAGELRRIAPAVADAAALDTDRILRSLGLVETLSDADLDALTSEN